MSGPGQRPLRGRAATAGLTVVAALLAAVLGIGFSVLPATAASRAGGGGGGTFGLTPLPDSNGRVAPYFTMTVAAGRSVTASALISNSGTTTEKLKISRSTGATAANGGSTFTQAFGGCAGAGCWVTGVPAAVTLRPGTGERLQFRLSVPAGTAPGQYLAGLTAEAAGAPQVVGLGKHGKAAGRAIIIQQVTVGVAVTVGSLSALTTRLAIPGVSATLIGSTVRLNIGLKNTGQTFAHGTGRATCTAAGQRHTYAIFASTVLPLDQAQIAVTALGVPDNAARMQCTMRLGYAHGLTASWSGPVTVPAPAVSRIVHTGPGAYSVVPAAGLPWWTIPLIVIAVLLASIVAVLVVRARGRGQVG